jgi:regulatory protein
VAGRRRARAGRGWDAAPARPRATAFRSADAVDESDPDTRERGRHTAAPAPARDADRAREICLRLLAVRPRTRQELASALRQRGIPVEVADEVLERYGEVGMVDDRAFARAWVTSRHHGKGLASRALAVELRRKGVEAEAIGVALDEIGDDVQARTARELVDRKLRGDRGAPDAALRRLVGMLARKGYPPGLAFRVVREALAEADMNVDDDADSLEAALEAEAAQAEDES